MRFLHRFCPVQSGINKLDPGNSITFTLALVLVVDFTVAFAPVTIVSQWVQRTTRSRYRCRQAPLGEVVWSIDK